MRVAEAAPVIHEFGAGLGLDHCPMAVGEAGMEAQREHEPLGPQLGALHLKGKVEQEADAVAAPGFLRPKPLHQPRRLQRPGRSGGRRDGKQPLRPLRRLAPGQVRGDPRGVGEGEGRFQRQPGQRGAGPDDLEIQLAAIAKQAQA